MPGGTLSRIRAGNCTSLGGSISESVPIRPRHLLCVGRVDLHERPRLARTSLSTFGPRQRVPVGINAPVVSTKEIHDRLARARLAVVAQTKVCLPSGVAKTRSW